MKNNYFAEIFISIILILLLFIFLNPFNLLMPPPFVKMLVIVFLLIIAIFASTIWKERSSDERENFHKLLAGHLAFFAGTALIGVAVAVQELNHNLDPWLIYILIAMVISKIIGRIYSEKNH